MSFSIPSSGAPSLVKPPSALADALRQSARSPKVVIGAVIVVAMVLCALFAPQIAPNDPENQDLVNMLLPPMWSAGGTSEYPFGTDSLGRCILSQMIYGARVALFVGFFAAIGAMLFGTTLALIRAISADGSTAASAISWICGCRCRRWCSR